MGCFLACFGSKDRKRVAQRTHKAPSPDRSYARQKPPQPSAFSQLEVSTNTNLTPEVGDDVEEKLSSSPVRKVTFNTDVKIYEPVSVQESTDSLPESCNDIKQKDDISGKSTLPCSLSEHDSVTSSVVSYPPNHRYHNCRDSDDEAEEFESEDSDSNDEDDDELEDCAAYDEKEECRIIPTVSMESKPKDSSACSVMEEVGNSLSIRTLPEQHMTKDGSSRNVRDRSGYVHPLLNPVENLTQWKALRTKGLTPSKPQKENILAQEETARSSFSSEPTFKHSSPNLTSKTVGSKNQNQDISVDSSLSNWLVSSESTPSNKPSESTGTKTITSERSLTPESNSWLSIEERPILGALTMEELKKFSTSSSPRKSPSRSPDEMAIIGTVGTYWSHSESTKDSDSVSSFKGIPNSTSKYREDKRVNWHSTPFETRLERALNGRG